MSLVKTLAKVAIGVMVAKGVSGMMKKGGTANAGTGDVFGGPNSPRSGGAGNGLDDLMGSILGGKSSTPQGGGIGKGGLGGLLEELSGGGQSGSTAGRGGMDDILGQLTGNRSSTSGGGGLGDLLGGILGGAAGGALAGGQTREKTAQSDKNQRPTKGFGDLFNEALVSQKEPETQPTDAQNAAAALMLKAMIQAAKSDGKIDENEKKKLLGNLGDASPEEMEFVKRELAAPIDIDALVRQTPRELAAQVYVMSAMTIDLDNQNEAEYLHRLATGFGINQQQVNALHAKLGKPALYS